MVVSSGDEQMGESNVIAANVRDDRNVPKYIDEGVPAKLRIAFVSSVYDHTDVGGGTFIQYLRSAVLAKRLDITFFSDDIARCEAPFEVRVALPVAVKRMPGGFLSRRYYYDQAIRRHPDRFDIIWYNNVLTSAGRGYQAPIVGMINDYNNAESSTPWATAKKFGKARAAIRFAWRQFERRAAARADCVVVNSKFMADYIRRSYKLAPSKIALLYKGVDLSGFEATTPRRLGTPLRILFVKRDYVRGGLLDLLAALSGLRMDFLLTIIGPPASEHERIRQIARQHNVYNIEILGAVARDIIPRYFASHDIFCVPSRSEALGVAFLEALASGLPAIGGNVGGIPEVLDSGRAGWLVEPQNVESLRQTLLTVIHDETERTKRTQRGLTVAQQFSFERMIDRIEEISRNVVYSRVARSDG